MSKQPMTQNQLREAINGLGPLAPDWLVEALEDFIELQEAHKNLLAIHAEDAYHLEEARAKLAQAQQPTNDEPVAFISHHASGIYVGFEPSSGDAVEVTPLYTRPQPANVTPETAVVPDAKDEIDHEGIWTNAHVAEQRYIQGWNDCRAAMLKGEK